MFIIEGIFLLVIIVAFFYAVYWAWDKITGAWNQSIGKTKVGGHLKEGYDIIHDSPGTTFTGKQRCRHCGSGNRSSKFTGELKVSVCRRCGRDL